MKQRCVILMPLLISAIAGGCGTEVNPTFAGSGIVEATEITVGAKTPGTILELAVDNGTLVRTGDLIARIDVEQFTLQRKIAEADLVQIDWSQKVQAQGIEVMREQVKQAIEQLDLAKKTFDRISNLYAQGAATADQLDRVTTEVAVDTAGLRTSESKITEAQASLSSLAAQRQKINANLELIAWNISNGAIAATDSGTVVEKYVESGETVMTGTPLVTIADLSTVKLRIYASEDMLGRIRIGEKAKIAADSRPGEEFEGAITWISPKAEFTPKNIQTRESRADLVYAVEITIPNPAGVFKIGMPADAYIPELAQ